ncbi:MAG: beta-lactamase family protein [Candidatus Hydrogenedentes bacterium]|nr:beta-lactamase family protein [Candidatus Hydrogenedentota bacterium]
MSPDDFQQAWRAEASQTRVTVNGDALLEAVRSKQQELRATIVWGDFSTIATELLLLPVFLYLGMATDAPWTWYLVVAAIFWSAAYKVARRTYGKRGGMDPGEPLLDGVRQSLALVDELARVRRNDFWRTQFTAAVAMTIFFVHVAWSVYEEPMAAIGNMAICLILVSSIYGFTYWLGRRVERTQYEPQRRELIALLEQLGDDATGEVSGEYPMLMTSMRVACSLRRKLIGWGLATLFLAIGIGGIVYGYSMDRETYPKLAPFTDVRWGEDVPVVEIDGEWHLLFSIDGLDVKEIVEFCKTTYGEKWQMRFGQDLVQILTEMGHTPKDTVQLDVLSAGLVSGSFEPSQSQPVRTVKDVAMTAGNRRAVRAAAEKREAREAADEASKAERAEPVVELDSAAPLVESLERVRAAYALPALAAFALRGDVIVEQAMVGTLSTKDDTPVSSAAQWHLGSNTKAMTATVAGMLVEEGLLRWDSTIGEVLGESAPGMDEGHRDTTLSMLLHHTSGITANIRWFSAPEDRIVCAAEILAEAPDGKRGEYAYSNAGYVVAGAMMEKVTGKTWEVLMREKLFAPLGMTNTGFGAPSAPGSPWGHESGLLGWSPKNPNARNADNPPVMGPAGTVHTTMEDYARFVAAHLKGAQGQGGIVSAQTFATLHAPLPGGDYGMGWIVTERGWSGGHVLTHGGSNTLWYTTVWLAPGKGMAFFAATNVGGDTAGNALNKAIEMLIGRHLPL